MWRTGLPAGDVDGESPHVDTRLANSEQSPLELWQRKTDRWYCRREQHDGVLLLLDLGMVDCEREA
jgi:hypothetical protein